MAAAAPVLLVGGWTLAAARQPSSYDSRTDTISQLAAVGATDSWIMTLVFATIGVCYVLIAVVSVVLFGGLYYAVRMFD